MSDEFEVEYPDGIQTVEIGDDDVVRHLPPRESAPFEFLFDNEQITIESAVYQAIGAASTCWESLDGTGVFDSDRAKAIGDELLAVIAALCETVRQAAVAGTN